MKNSETRKCHVCKSEGLLYTAFNNLSYCGSPLDQNGCLQKDVQARKNGDKRKQYRKR